MTDIASVIPDTATVPVAEDLKQPLAQQNGHQSPGHFQVAPVDDSVTSGHSLASTLPSNADLLKGKVLSDSAEDGLPAQKQNGAALNVEKSEEPKPKTGVAALLEQPLKGPRNGIHWGAG